MYNVTNIQQAKKEEQVKIEDMLYEIFISVDKQSGPDGDELIFKTDEGVEYVMYHDRECCEDVYIEDINGDLSDLVGNPILVAGETISFLGDTEEDEERPSRTWSFYRLGTIKGTVVIRWYGASNGYYSERVDIIKKTPIN